MEPEHGNSMEVLSKQSGTAPGSTAAGRRCTRRYPAHKPRFGRQGLGLVRVRVRGPARQLLDAQIHDVAASKQRSKHKGKQCRTASTTMTDVNGSPTRDGN